MLGVNGCGSGGVIILLDWPFSSWTRWFYWKVVNNCINFLILKYSAYDKLRPPDLVEKLTGQKNWLFGPSASNCNDTLINVALPTLNLCYSLQVNTLTSVLSSSSRVIERKRRVKSESRLRVFTTRYLGTDWHTQFGWSFSFCRHLT